MALHGFENFNAAPQQSGGAFQLPQLGSFNATPSNFGTGANFQPANPLQGLNLDFKVDPAQLGGETDYMKLLFGGMNADGSSQLGAVTGGLGAIAGIGQAVLGYKQYGLAKKELAFQQEQAGINNRNQMTTLNNLMRGQADNRAIATGGQSLGGDEYIKQFGIKV
ncbi:MAG: hypothetical protein HRT86_10985 [Ilumatobacteraceae bacterium]|nr:hypothetical protein [Ilumatobacteraceae bacterium]